MKQWTFTNAPEKPFEVTREHVREKLMCNYRDIDNVLEDLPIGGIIGNHFANYWKEEVDQ